MTRGVLRGVPRRRRALSLLHLRQILALVTSLAPAVGALAVTAAGAPEASFPADHRHLRKTISYDEMAAYLESLSGHRHITVTSEGTTTQGRSLFLVHLKTGSERPQWRVLLYAQQHGDEVSGKDALLYLVRGIAEEPLRLPADVDLWVMPMINPDGAVARQRRNSAGADLNRDHQWLRQRETQALHRVARRVRPHLAVDCHEFTRGGKEYAERGWDEWPIIMMDTANHPIFDAAVTAAGLRWVQSAAAGMADAGLNYERYSVGGLPPDDEQRYSSPEVDDGRNGLGAFGGISLIIEAGVRRHLDDPDIDLAQRVDAYLTLLRPFIDDASNRATDIEAVSRARQALPPPFIATNVFWANAGHRVTRFKLLDAGSGRTIEVPTANFMADLVVKRSVPTPAGYAIEPAAAQVFRPLLERHAIPFVELGKRQSVLAERCRLVRVEEEYDAVYARYEGRQIVERVAPIAAELAAGTLLVTLDGPEARRAALLLEPTMMYGLFQEPEVQTLIGAEGALPVLRVLETPRSSSPVPPDRAGFVSPQ